MTTTASPSTRGSHHVEHVMGMAVSIDVRDGLSADVLAEAVGDVVAWLHHVDATFSAHKATSLVSRLGLGQLALADMTDEVLDVVELCEDLYEDTQGAFDAWSVRAPTGGRFDPSGVVKGWSIERAARILEGHGARSFCINAGGDIALRGERAPGLPWRVGIRHPRQPLASAAVLQWRGRWAVATSATYERGAHIVDPATGEPTAGLASVTVVGPDLTFADAYATAVFVQGLDGLTWLHDRHPDYAALAITHDERTLATPGFRRLRIA